MRGLFIVFMTLFSLHGISQTKKELLDKAAVQQSKIDSLTKVVANMENIIENRDRSVKIAKEHREEMKKEKEAALAEMQRQEFRIYELEAQNKVGTAKIISMSNSRSKMKVKEGKTWTINQFMTDFTSEVKTDSSGQQVFEEVHIFLKEINGTILTDTSAGKLGPQVYSSLHPEHTLKMPIIFNSGDSFSIIVLKGQLSDLKPHDARVYCSITEK